MKHMRMPIAIAATVIIGGLCSGVALASSQAAPQPSGTAGQSGAHEALAGIWTNIPEEENSAPPPETGRFGTPGNAPGGGSGGRGGGGHGGRGGGGGGGGYSGGGFGGYGGRGARGGATDNENEAKAAALSVFERALMDPVKQMTIVVHDPSVTIVYDDGHTEELKTNGKKVSEKAENGFVKFTRLSHWDGSALISDIAVSDGPNFQRRYDITADGKTLRVSTTPSRNANGSGRDGGGGHGLTYGRTATHVYGRPSTTEPAESAAK